MVEEAGSGQSIRPRESRDDTLKIDEKKRRDDVTKRVGEKSTIATNIMGNKSSTSSSDDSGMYLTKDLQG